ncbi:MAG: hypothetical protein ACYCST_04495 [Acidimicrobiales bacterium]
MLKALFHLVVIAVLVLFVIGFVASVGPATAIRDTVGWGVALFRLVEHLVGHTKAVRGTKS